MNSSKVDFLRTLKLNLPRDQSAFLWGARKTGKTTYLSSHFQNSTFYDFLENDTQERFLKEPSRFRQEIIEKLDNKTLVTPVIIDEIQKLPKILDEVHWLIEKKKVNFLLCGSSARKLKRSHANLLGGRAWRFELHPLTSHEMGPSFNLLRALNQGLIPSHYLTHYPDRTIKSYIRDYLKEEIQQEGVVRNLPAFARFLDSMAFSLGEMVNYTNIAQDCAIDAKTVAEYYQILVDTLLGHFIEPFRKRKNRAIIRETPKFYFFDVGVATYLKKQKIMVLQGEEFGRAFENFILMELIAYRSYLEKDFPIHYWRTKEGYEVDFVLNDGQIAIEVKGTSRLSRSDFKGMNVFIEEHQPQKRIIVCQEPVARKLENDIFVYPWKDFLEKLWKGEIIKS